ncbi:MAG TPA: 2-oxoacid:acceptor oxidoreductase family protein [Syntrophorhabdaceae bacterium]|nr:2-oxoacid:acceptor oxidoreductase family protein [Syntrophorhabdaceae bacterium]
MNKTKRIFEQTPETMEIICAGIGGRGVLLASTLLIECAVDAGLSAIASDEYGMSQRGGSVVSHVKIGDAKSPVVGRENAHVLLAFEESEFYRNLTFIRRGGLAIINSRNTSIFESVDKVLKKRNIAYFLIDGDKIAKEKGMIQASNMAILGFFSAFSIGPYNHDALRHTIEKKVKESLVLKNIEVFEEGFLKAVSLSKNL